MNNLQFSLSIGLPIFFILVGMFFNWSMANGLRGEFSGLRGEFNDLRGEFNDLRGEFNDLRSEVRGDINDLRSEVRGDINDLRSKVRGDINDLRSKLDDVKDSNHKDALEIMRQMTALHERVAIVESKQR